MTPYAAAQPETRFLGSRCIELGSGPGLVGLLLARLGAHVIITDKDVVLPLIEENVQLNGLSDRPSGGCLGRYCVWLCHAHAAYYSVN